MAQWLLFLAPCYVVRGQIYCSLLQKVSRIPYCLRLLRLVSGDWTWMPFVNNSFIFILLFRLPLLEATKFSQIFRGPKLTFYIAALEDLCNFQRKGQNHSNLDSEKLVSWWKLIFQLKKKRQNWLAYCNTLFVFVMAATAR